MLLSLSYNNKITNLLLMLSKNNEIKEKTRPGLQLVEDVEVKLI